MTARPLVIAHRGYSGSYPENTLISLGKAAKLGCDLVELDLRLSSDEIFMVLHERGVRLATGGQDTIDAFTAAEIKRADVGSWFHPRFAGARVPTFDEALDLLRDSPARLCIELKDLNGREIPGYEDRIVALFRREKLFAKAVVNVEPMAFVQAIKRKEPRIRVALDSRHADWTALSADEILERVLPSGADIIQYEHEHLSADIVRVLRSAGFAVWAWTVNARDDMIRLIDWGVDGILTDHPERLLRLRRPG